MTPSPDCWLQGPEWAGVRIVTTMRRRPGAGWEDFNLALHTVSDPTAVLANRRQLRNSLPQEPRWLTQVHGAKVHDADAPQDEAAPSADAAITQRSDRVLAILTADCLPVVIVGTKGEILGIAHAGWRGLANGVLEETLAALRARVPARVGWRAWIGPAIRQKSYRVGAEVRQAFVATDPGAEVHFLPQASQKWLADLPGLARRRLERAGVDEVLDCGRCTFSESSLFYSYRRDGTPGRQATLAWLTTR